MGVFFNSFNANEFFSNLFNPNRFFKTDHVLLNHLSTSSFFLFSFFFFIFYFLFYITNSLTFWSFKRKILYYENNIFHYLFTIISTITFLNLYKVIMKKIIIFKIWFKLFSFNFFFQYFTLI